MVIQYIYRHAVLAGLTYYKTTEEAMSYFQFEIKLIVIWKMPSKQEKRFQTNSKFLARRIAFDTFFVYFSNNSEISLIIVFDGVKTSMNIWNWMFCK